MDKNGKQQFHQWIAKQQQARAKHNMNGSNNAVNNVSNNQQVNNHTSNRTVSHGNNPLLHQQAVITKLKRKLKSSQNQTAYLRKQRDDKRDQKQAVKEDKGIHKITHGFNEVFDKEYPRTYIDKDTHKTQHYQVHIVLKPMTMADHFAIDSEDERITNTMGRYFEANEYYILHAFTTMKVEGQKEGTEVPKQFQNANTATDMGFLVQVYLDFLHWERNFRRYSKTE